MPNAGLKKQLHGLPTTAPWSQVSLMSIIDVHFALLSLLCWLSVMPAVPTLLFLSCCADPGAGLLSALQEGFQGRCLN